MGDLQIVIAALFISAAGLNALTNWLQVPYPIPLVIGGLIRRPGSRGQHGRGERGLRARLVISRAALERVDELEEED